jgi:hypothetical protein
MIYVTGDTHGTIDIHKLNSKNFPEGRTLTKDDYVIICGDFGFVWNGDKEDQWWLNWLDNKPWTTLFVDGNHENHDMLEQMEVTEWHGGKVHRINESVIHLMRGQVYEINGKKWFTFGGAKSQDQMIRVEGRDWWAGEMASEQEYEEAVRNLAANGWTVDYVVTHCAPSRFAHQIKWWYEPDRMTNFLDYSIYDRLGFGVWFCGHYHTDMVMEQEYGKGTVITLYRMKLHIR